MRAVYIALPAGLALACAGGALMVIARASRTEPHGVDPWLLPGAVRHLVTPQMTRETDGAGRVLLPTFRTRDAYGKPVALAVHGSAHPQFVYFVLDGCPCSYDAEPLFHKLYARYRGKIDFASVTDAGRARARQWSTELLVHYPVVPDPEKKIIHAYGARASVYSVLIGPDGRVIRMWPGYSAGLLRDMNVAMAHAAGVPPKPFDTEYAPAVKATGCAF